MDAEEFALARDVALVLKDILDTVSGSKPKSKSSKSKSKDSSSKRDSKKKRSDDKDRKKSEEKEKERKKSDRKDKKKSEDKEKKKGSRSKEERKRAHESRKEKRKRSRSRSKDRSKSKDEENREKSVELESEEDEPHRKEDDWDSDADEVDESSVPNTVGGALCTFYSDSPFSDFTNSPFMYDGKFYHSMEHFFQIQMIFSFGMFRLAQKIREIPEANLFRKTLRQNLKTMVKSGLFSENMFAEWRKTNAYNMMRRGNKAKFEQNFNLKEQLLATGERLLIFTAKNDSLLGVGMTEARFLHWMRVNRFCLEDLLDFFTGTRPRPKGMGRNYLGLALMEVRAELSGKPSILYEWKQHRPDINPEDWVGDIEPSGEKETEFPPAKKAKGDEEAEGII